MKSSKAVSLHQNVPSDWYERGIKANLGQRYWHYRRFKEIGKMIEPVKGKALDVGCADGTFTKIIVKKTGAEEVVGIDVLQNSVNYAQKRFAGDSRFRFRVADASRLPFPDESFEAAFCLEVLEHVFSPEKVLAEVKRVLKKQGYAIFLVPSENLLFKIIWFFWLKTGGKVWRGTHLHQFDHHRLAHLIADCQGFTLVKEKNFLLGMLKVIKVRKENEGIRRHS